VFADMAGADQIPGVNVGVEQVAEEQISPVLRIPEKFEGVAGGAGSGNRSPNLVRMGVRLLYFDAFHIAKIVGDDGVERGWVEYGKANQIDLGGGARIVLIGV